MFTPPRAPWQETTLDVETRGQGHTIGQVEKSECEKKESVHEVPKDLPDTNNTSPAHRELLKVKISSELNKV